MFVLVKFCPYCGSDLATQGRYDTDTRTYSCHACQVRFRVELLEDRQ